MRNVCTFYRILSIYFVLFAILCIQNSTAIASTQTTHPKTIFSDSFVSASTTVPNTVNWRLNNTAGASAPELDGSDAIVLQVDNQGNTQRSFVVSDVAAFKIPDLNNDVIVLRTDAIQLNGSASSGSNAFYAGIGRANNDGLQNELTDVYWPKAPNFNGTGGMIAYSVHKSDNGQPYMVYYDWGNQSTGTNTFTLDQVPSAVKMKVDLTDPTHKIVRFILTGASFIDNTLSAKKVIELSVDHFSWQSLSMDSDGNKRMRMFMGAFNAGSLASSDIPTSANIGSLYMKSYSGMIPITSAPEIVLQENYADVKWGSGHFTSSVWNPVNGGNAATSYIDNSINKLTFTINANNGSHRAFMVSNTLAHSLNPFNQSIQLNVEGLELEGETNGDSANVFYAGIGRSENDESTNPDSDPFESNEDAAYWPSAKSFDSAGGFLGYAIYKKESGYILRFYDWGNGYTPSPYDVELNGLPTDIIFHTNLTNARKTVSIDLTGTTYYDGNNTKVFDVINFNQSSVVNDHVALRTRIFMGAINAGTVSEPTVAKIAAVNVQAKPTQFRGINVSLRTFKSENLDQYHVAFNRIRNEGANTVRLVMITDPNRQPKLNVQRLQHDFFYRWMRGDNFLDELPGESVHSKGDYGNGDVLVFNTDEGFSFNLQKRGFSKLLDVLEAARKAGLLVILDIHNPVGQDGYEFWAHGHPTRLPSETDTPEEQARTAKGKYFQDHYKKFWNHLFQNVLSKTQKTRVLIDVIAGYDLMNEPDLLRSYPTPAVDAEYDFKSDDGTPEFDPDFRTVYYGDKVNDIIEGYVLTENLDNHIPAAWNGNHNLNIHRLMEETISIIRDEEDQLANLMDGGRVISKSTIVPAWGTFGFAYNFKWLEPVEDRKDNTVYTWHNYIQGGYTLDNNVPVNGDFFTYLPYKEGAPSEDVTSRIVDWFEIRKQLEKVTDFTNKHQLAADRIYVGELGVGIVNEANNAINSNPMINFNGEFWLRDNLAYMQAVGWSWTYWHDTIGDLNPHGFINLDPNPENLSRYYGGDDFYTRTRDPQYVYTGKLDSYGNYYQYVDINNNVVYENIFVTKNSMIVLDECWKKSLKDQYDIAYANFANDGDPSTNPDAIEKNYIVYNAHYDQYDNVMFYSTPNTSDAGAKKSMQFLKLGDDDSDMQATNASFKRLNILKMGWDDSLNFALDPDIIRP